MAITPPTIVVGPPHAPLPFGLFSAITFRDDSTDRWEGGGVGFENVGGDPGPLKALAHNCTTDTPLDFDEAGRAISYSEPFTVMESYACSPAGNSIDKAREVAEQRLTIREEARVEEVIAHGIEGIDRDLTGATPLDEADDLQAAIAQLEWMMATEYMGQGVIHMSRATAMHALAEGVVETANSGRLRTLLHTPVVAGTGYSFEGLIGSPALFGYRSDIITFDGAEMLDRGTNDLHAVAERSYLIGWADLPIFHATYANVSGGGGGVRGASAYEVAVENGFEGTEAEWLDSLVGPPGADGQDGAPGADGQDGAEGPEGPEGPPGADGQDGAPGADGADGVDGIVQAIIAGDGIVVDATDPASPIISASAE